MGVCIYGIAHLTMSVSLFQSSPEFGCQTKWTLFLEMEIIYTSMLYRP